MTATRLDPEFGAHVIARVAHLETHVANLEAAIRIMGPLFSVTEKWAKRLHGEQNDEAALAIMAAAAKGKRLSVHYGCRRRAR